jgi:CRP-like cAMP-binding protein
MNPVDLEQFAFLAGLSLQARKIVEKAAVRRTYAPGQIIMMEGDECSKVFFLCEGSVRAYRTNPEGREQTLAYLKPGEIFNLPAVFSRQHLAPATAAAVTEAAVMEIGQEDFQRIASQTPEIALRVMGELSDRLSYFSDLVHDVSLRNVRGRLARFLLVQAEESLTRSWTQEEIALQLGTSREVVSRSLRALVRDGLVSMARQNIRILDAEALKKEAGL